MASPAKKTRKKIRKLSDESRRRKRAVYEADKWFSRYIRKRDGLRSVISGSTNKLTCSHLFSRRSYATRWDEENAYCQTAGENLYHNRDAGPLTTYYLELHSAEEYRELYRQYRNGAKFTTEEIEEIARYYRMRLQRLERGHEFFNVI
jgi:hypothetical protein